MYSSDDEFDIERLVKRFKLQQQQNSEQLCDNVEANPKNLATASIRQQARQQHRKLLRTHFSHKLQCRKAKRLTSLLLMAQITTIATTTSKLLCVCVLMEGSRTTV